MNFFPHVSKVIYFVFKAKRNRYARVENKKT